MSNPTATLVKAALVSTLVCLLKALALGIIIPTTPPLLLASTIFPNLKQL